MRRIGWLTVIAIGMAGCGEPQAPEQMVEAGGVALEGAAQRVGSQQRERERLRRVDLAHSAASSSLPSGFLGRLTDDAVFLFPNAPYVQGKAAIRDLLVAPPAPFVPGITLSWVPVLVDVSTDAEVGYSFGNAQITRPGLPTLLGQYIAFWRKQNGSWRVEAWNMSPAFFPPAALPAGFGELLLASGGGTFGPVDMARETRRLMAVDAAFSRTSVELGQAAAFGKYAHEHAIVLGGGNPDFYVGRREIVQSRAQATGTLSWTPQLGGVGPRGDLGWSMGTYLSQSEDRTGHGKYLSVWQKTENGKWKFVQDAGSGNPAPVP